MHFGFNNQFIKSHENLVNISKKKSKNQKIFCFALISGITNLYIKCIPDIKKGISFIDIRPVRFHPIR
jgi:hypothetical protein